MRTDERLHLSYLGSGDYRECYDILNDAGQPTGRVLKVDTKRIGSLRIPHSRFGCDEELGVFTAIQSDAPELLPYFATIYDAGPGWLVQERIAHPCTNEGFRLLNSALRELEQHLGFTVADARNCNVGQRFYNAEPVIFDYAISRRARA